MNLYKYYKYMGGTYDFDFPETLNYTIFIITFVNNWTYQPAHKLVKKNVKMCVLYVFDI